MGNHTENLLTVTGMTAAEMTLLSRACVSDDFPHALVKDKEKWGTPWCKVERFELADMNSGNLEVRFFSSDDPLGEECLQEISKTMPKARLELRFYNDGSEYYGATYATNGRTATFSSRLTSLDPDILVLEIQSTTQYSDIRDKQIDEVWYQENEELARSLGDEDASKRAWHYWFEVMDSILRPYLDSMLEIAKQRVDAESHAAEGAAISTFEFKSARGGGFVDFCRKKLGELQIAAPASSDDVAPLTPLPSEEVERALLEVLDEVWCQNDHALPLAFETVEEAIFAWHHRSQEGTHFYKNPVNNCLVLWSALFGKDIESVIREQF